MKRFLILTLVIAMLMIPTAQAESSPMRRFKLEATVSGEELDVRIYADMTYPNDTTGLDSIDFALSYSTDILELIGSVKEDDRLESDVLDSSFIYEENTSETGRYRMSAMSITGSAGTGLLVRLRFKIIGEGYYGFRLVRDLAEYSVYDSANGTQTSYQLPRLEIDAEITGSSSIADATDKTAMPQSGENQPAAAQTETAAPAEQTESGFLRFWRSIFGSSCFGG